MPTRRQIATSILGIYRRQQARVGYILPAKVIAALSNESGSSIDETVDGINYGQAEGWFHLCASLVSDIDGRRLCPDGKWQSLLRGFASRILVEFAADTSAEGSSSRALVHPSREFLNLC